MKSPIEIIRDLQSRKVVVIHNVQVTEQDIADIQQEAYNEGVKDCGRALENLVANDPRIPTEQ
jgi:hypothetical protein